MTNPNPRLLASILVLLTAGGCLAQDLDDLESSESAALGPATPIELARVDYVYGLVTDGTYVYFAWFDDGVEGLSRVPVGGGTVELVDGGTHYSLALDATHLYWADWDGRLFKQAKNGGAPLLLADTEGSIGDLALDVSSIYFTLRGFGNSVMRVSKNGGTPVAVATSQEDPYAIAVDTSRVYWTTLGMGNPAIGCTDGEGKVWRVSKFGGLPLPLVINDFCPTSIATDAGNIYWSSWFGKLRKLSKLGGLPVVLSTDAGELLAVDTAGVYYNRGSDDALVRRGPFPGEKLVAAHAPATVLATDGLHVYWAQPQYDEFDNYLEMAIVKANKP